MSLKVNGQTYGWGDVDVKIPGLVLVVQEISYDDEQEMEESYGKGYRPRGYGKGNYKASGKMSMLRDDFDDVLAYCKAKGIPFYGIEWPSVVVSYANEGERTRIDELKKVNDETLRTLNNAPKGEQLSISITSEKLYTLGLNTVNNLVIEASDGQGGTSYRRLTFKRTNSAPSISGEDKDLGQQTGSFAEKYTVTDVEGDNVVVTEFVDDQEIRSYQATLGEEETIELSREKWLTLTNGAHQLRVEAVDGNFATSVRVWNFSKKETVIKFQFAKPEETDARATKILITPTWKIEGSVAKVEACNNAFDAAPTWEDITAQVAINRVFNFTNETKTAEKWGVDVRFTIKKNEGYEGEVSISGFGGAYK